MRTPLEHGRGRMAPLARLPVFFDLNGRNVLISGGSAAAAWKAELLAAAGARVRVVAAETSEAMTEAAAQAEGGSITLIRRAWTTADLDDAAMAIGAFDDDAEAARFAVAARAAGVPVNVIDKPNHCDFAFGAIVNRSPLVIGISTDGAAPVFGQAIRAKIEGLLPRGLAAWAAAAKRWRGDVQRSGLSFNARKGFWRLFTDRAMAQPQREPQQNDFDALMRDAFAGARATDVGSVALVGAGPGDPALLTLRAVRALQSADIILYDDLVSAEVLDFARREARKMLVGKTGHAPSCKQQDINALMVGLARSGKRVVRLKGGDPMIFGRAGEEIDACRAAGVSIEVIPGITAAQGAAATLGISLTQRKDARRLQYLTGHGADGRLPDDIAWSALADPTATTAVYMPTKTLDDLVSQAITAGLDPSTPAVAISRATRPDERHVTAPVASLSQAIAAAGLPGPVVVMFGRAFATAVAASDTGAVDLYGVATGASSDSTLRISSWIALRPVVRASSSMRAS